MWEVFGLQGCFDCTMWEVFEDSSSDLDELTDVVSDHVSFCVESVPNKTCTIFFNNKPWVSKQLSKTSADLGRYEGQNMANELNIFFSRFEASLQMFPRVIFWSCSEYAAYTKAQAQTISVHVLMHCAEQLAGVLTDIFQSSLDQQHVSVLWKNSIIIPIPEASNPSVLNDYRPVALTSLVMNCLEKIVKSHILSHPEARPISVCLAEELMMPFLTSLTWSIDI